MKKSLIFLSILLAFSILLAGRDRHRGGEGGPPPNPIFKTDRALEMSGVSQEIRAKVRKKLHNQEKELMDIGFKIHELNLSMKEEYKKSTPDLKKLKASVAKIADLRRQQFIKIGNMKIEIMSMLTVEQREKMMKFNKKRRHRMMKKWRD